MAAVVYNGLQSCLESQLVESRILRLKLFSAPLPPCTPFNSQSIELALKSCLFDSNNESTVDFTHDYNFGGFTSLQALPNKSQEKELSTITSTIDTSTTPYVHPMLKRSSTVMSERSLQLCTENLGNETGTDMTEITENLGIGSFDTTTEQVKVKPAAAPRLSRSNKKAKTGSDFPPPLKTMRGSEGIRVRAEREEGRLVIKVEKVQSRLTCFQAERSHGRLRLLCFSENKDSIFDSEERGTEEEENDGSYKECEEESQNEGKGQRQDMEEEEHENVEYGADGDVCSELSGDDMDGNKLNVGGEMGMEKYERLRRCRAGESESTSLLNSICDGCSLVADRSC